MRDDASRQDGFIGADADTIAGSRMWAWEQADRCYGGPGAARTDVEREAVRLADFIQTGTFAA